MFLGGGCSRRLAIGEGTEFLNLCSIPMKKTCSDAATIAATKVVDSQPKSRMWYRIGATRNMTGGRRIQPGGRMSDTLKQFPWYLYYL